MSTGACMPADRVWWVNQAVAVSGEGSEGSPFKTIAEALALIGAGEAGTVIVATVNPHVEAVSVPGGRTLALLGDGEGASLEIQGMPVLQVNSNATLFAANLAINKGTPGLFCSGGSVWLNASSILANAGRGLSIDDCTVTLRESRVANNGQAGVHLIAGHVRMVNSMVSALSPSVPAVLIAGGSVDVVYSTLVSGGLGAPAVECTNGGAASEFRNSIIGSLDVSSEFSGCGNATVTTSAVEGELDDNVSLGNLVASWFVDFNGGDLRLSGTAPSEIATAAVWLDGDPLTDIDGTARPGVDGAPDYAGAAVP